MMEIPYIAIEKSIDRGTILHSNIFENIGHGKFFVVIGVYENRIAGFFFINSNIHPSIFKKKEQLSMQYLLKKNDYPFLRYDSFLCATNIITRDCKDLVESIKNNKTSIIGKIKDCHIEEILEMVRNSRLFSKMDKQHFFY